MAVAKHNTSFQPPIPRPKPQLWHAVYELPRKTFLDAVEQVVAQLPPPRQGLHWEYEGFNRRHLFLLPVADSDDSSEYFQSVELGLDVGGGKIHVYVESVDNSKIQLFKDLLTKLNSLDYIAQACVTPCSMLDLYRE